MDLPKMPSPSHLVFDTFPLARGTQLRLQDARGTLVYARGGEMWLTQEGERRDVFLRAGQGFRIERDGATVISALRTGSLAIYPPRAEAPAGFLSWLASRLPA